MKLEGFTVPTIFIVSAFLLITGCSSGGSSQNPLAPVTNQSVDGISNGLSTNHSLLGLYEMRFDPFMVTMEVVPLRDSMMHLNALRFLEPPPPVKIKVTNLEFDGQILDADVELLHPFPGLDKFTGFDVDGIVISSGSINGFSDSDLVVAGDGDTRLINADGLTRWWNPREFPYNQSTPIFGYIDGGKGTPDSVANYTATLNGYKYFANGLSVLDDLEDLDTSLRGAFLAGAGNTRHYTIDMDGGFVFNYAVDACWFPTEDDPVIVPDSFSESANREEPWLIQTEVTSNTLWFNPILSTSGGELALRVTLTDWFHADENIVRVESPGNFSPVLDSVPELVAPISAVYDVSVVGVDLNSADPIAIWVSAEAGMDYEGLLPGKATSAFANPFDVSVEIQTQTDELVLVWGDTGVINHPYRVLYNDIEPALIVNGEGNMLLSFSYWQDIGEYMNIMMFTTSYDHGMTFGDAGYSGWHSHSGPYSLGVVYNNKYCLAANGWAFHTYRAPCGHTISNTPDFDPYTEARSFGGPVMEHAGEMMYTVNGNPMMFGDEGGTILMRRGDFPNQGGTGSWPEFNGTEYTVVAEALLNYLSVSRSTGKTSDGRCHLMFWHSPTTPYIRLVSADSSGTVWDTPVIVFDGSSGEWVGAYDPSLWIDDNDGFHTLFVSENISGNYYLYYGYSADGADWNDMTSFTEVMQVSVSDGMNDTQVVMFDAFDETWVFLSYETAGNVWCRYKKIGETNFSDPISVADSTTALVPDVYPNGDVGLTYSWQADDGTGNDLTDIYYRTAWFELE